MTCRELRLAHARSLSLAAKPLTKAGDPRLDRGTHSTRAARPIFRTTRLNAISHREWVKMRRNDRHAFANISRRRGAWLDGGEFGPRRMRGS